MMQDIKEEENVSEQVKQPWEDLPTDVIYYEKMYDDGHLGNFTESPEMAYRFGWTENRISKDDIKQSDINGLTYQKDKCPMKTEADIERDNAVARIAELKKYLADTDYKAIKYAEGRITDTEYEDTSIERQKARNEINELERKYER